MVTVRETAERARRYLELPHEVVSDANCILQRFSRTFELGVGRSIEDGLVVHGFKEKPSPEDLQPPTWLSESIELFSRAVSLAATKNKLFYAIDFPAWQSFFEFTRDAEIRAALGHELRGWPIDQGRMFVAAWSAAVDGTRRFEEQLAIDEAPSPDAYCDPASETDLLTSSHPDAAKFRDAGNWCTAAYAKKRYSIGGSQLTRACKNACGFRVSQKPLIQIPVARRKAQVSVDDKRPVYVYHAGDLRRLADAVSEKKGE